MEIFRQKVVVALRNNNSGVRKQAAAALGQLGWQPVDETQSALLVIVQLDWDRAVSLGLAALAPLVAALSDTNSRVREQAGAAQGQRFGCTAGSG